MNFMEIEYAGFRSWPAFEESECDGVVLRFSQGHTKRANSANILTHQEDDYSTLVSSCEDYFEKKGLPCIFRLPSYCDNQQLDTYLEDSGYKMLDRSLILHRSLNESSFDSPALVTKNSREWMQSYCAIRGFNMSEHEAHLEILERIQDNVFMAVLVEDGIEVACGIGVISGDYFGLFDVVTKESMRNMGYGTKILNGMLNWAITNGATKAYLQVVADNHLAISLYKKLGYQTCYEYWYRISDKDKK